MPSMSDYIDQIIRDSKVLAGDPIFHQPSREFYEDRVAACMSAIEQLAQDSQKEQA